MGLSFQFDRAWSDFPSDTWTLTYRLRNRLAAPIDITASAATNNLDFEIRETPATTATWIAGKYQMIGTVSDGTNKHQVYCGDIELLVDPEVEFNYDRRTYWERRLEAIEDALATTAPDKPVSYSINGRSFTFPDLESKQAEWSFANARVQNERRAGKNAKVLVRFRKAR